MLAAMTGAEVRDVDVLRGTVFRYHGQQATLAGASSAVAGREQLLRFLDGNAAPILASLPNRDRVIVSEPFATRHNVHTGDTLQIPLGDRTVALTVAGIYYDYSSELGYVILDRSTLLKYLPDQPVTNLAVWGNHSSTMFPDFHNAKIAGRPLTDVIGHHAWLEGEFISTVQQRGAAIIKARGS